MLLGQRTRFPPTLPAEILRLLQGSEASSHALLFTTANLTSGNPQVSYTSCAQSNGPTVGGTALTNLQSISSEDSCNGMQPFHTIMDAV